MYGMTPMGVFFTAIFPLEINEQALCQQPHVVPKLRNAIPQSPKGRASTLGACLGCPSAKTGGAVNSGSKNALFNLIVDWFG